MFLRLALSEKARRLLIFEDFDGQMFTAYKYCVIIFWCLCQNVFWCFGHKQHIGLQIPGKK